MISELSVSQLAIIDQTTIRLESGFTVLTGETGAGKSLLIDAIQLVLGERADAELVRANAKSANVSVAFDLSLTPEIQRQCEDLGVPLEDSILFVSREVFAEGRSQCRLGGRLMPVSVLRQLGDMLVDLHGQHDHQSLLQQERHLAYLDLWIGGEAKDLRQKTRSAFEAYSEARRKLSAVRADIRNRDQKADLLRHQIAEIEAASPQPGEFDQVQNSLSRLQNIEKLVLASQSALEQLSTADGSASELLGSALKSLEEGQRFDPTLGALADRLREVLYEVDDLGSSLTHFTDNLESSPGELEELSNRLEVLKKLRRKYGEDEVSILELLADSQIQLAALDEVEASEEILEQEVKKTERAVTKSAGELSAVRKAKAKQFSQDVEAQLQELALTHARFGVGIKPTELTAAGVDEVEFVFSANPGEPLRPLARVASGGEVSRLMLAMKTVLAGKAGVPTLIFDEIDTGLGGRVGATVGRKLSALSHEYQVIVISHLPQVAALADVHYRIEKSEKDGRTTTNVKRLNGEERLEEIARMLAGERLTDTAIAHAKEMLTREVASN
jgi:DNA repair protein RecN (Recombination protein N)